MVNRRRSKIEKEVDEELIKKGKSAINDFDESQSLHVRSQKPENKMISIRLPQAMIETLRVIAIGKGDIGYQQLIKTYIAGGILLDRRAVSQLQEEFKSSVQINNAPSSSSVSQEFPGVAWISGSTEPIALNKKGN